MGEGWERPAGRARAAAPDRRAHERPRRLRGRQAERAPARASSTEAVGEGVELVPAGDLVEELRAVKDEGEVERIAAAAELTDEVYRWAIDQGLAGRPERDVARACEARIRELGAEPSFPPIVAAGPNGALPHAEPGEREIGKGELVVFDMGAELDGYCSDCTRTFATGDPGAEAREVYELVREAQAAALEALRPGLSGRDADAVARKLIEAAGHGERFGHGLGHGVGIEVHEAPAAGRRAPRTSCGRATSSPSSRASTCPGSSAFGSRTWSSSARTGTETSAASTRASRSAAVSRRGRARGSARPRAQLQRDQREHEGRDDRRADEPRGGRGRHVVPARRRSR